MANLVDEILTENEINAVRQFTDSEVMREAVKKVLLASVYENGVLKKNKKADATRNLFLSVDWDTPNDHVGAQVRAIYEGIKLVEIAFSNLAKYKTEEESTKKVVNPAR